MTTDNDDWDAHKLLILAKLEHLEDSVERVYSLLENHMNTTAELQSRIRAVDAKIKVYLAVVIAFIAPFLTFLLNYIFKH